MADIPQLIAEAAGLFTHKSNCPHCYGTLYEGRTDRLVEIPCRNIKYPDPGAQRKFNTMRMAIQAGLFDPKKQSQEANHG